MDPPYRTLYDVVNLPKKSQERGILLESLIGRTILLPLISSAAQNKIVYELGRLDSYKPDEISLSSKNKLGTPEIRNHELHDISRDYPILVEVIS